MCVCYCPSVCAVFLNHEVVEFQPRIVTAPDLGSGANAYNYSTPPAPPVPKVFSVFVYPPCPPPGLSPISSSILHPSTPLLYLSLYPLLPTPCCPGAERPSTWTTPPPAGLHRSYVLPSLPCRPSEGVPRHVYIFSLVQLFGWCYISWLLITVQSFSEMWIRMAGEFINIFYIYVFGLYVVSLTSTTANQNHECHQKDRCCLFYYVQIHISRIFIFWTQIQGYHITRLVWRTRIIFRFFSYVVIAHLLQIREDVGIFWNQLHPGLPWSSRFTNELDHYLLFQIPNMESGFSASLEYIQTHDLTYMMF